MEIAASAVYAEVFCVADIVRHPLILVGVPSKTRTRKDCGRPLGISEFLDIAQGESVGYIVIVALAFPYYCRSDFNCIVDDGKTVPGLQKTNISRRPRVKRPFFQGLKPMWRAEKLSPQPL